MAAMSASSTPEAETLSPVLPDELEALARRLLETAARRKKMLATAESCTGGLLASLLTDVEGASHVFERGFVVYSDDAKCELLGIARQDIEQCGAVSREVAIGMAEGALRQSQADVAISITGFAGSAGTGEEEGLVHLACACREGPVTHREEHFGPVGRGRVRIACLNAAIEMMLTALA